MHEKYGQTYLSGSGIGQSAYVKAWSEKQGEIINAYLCVKCGDPAFCGIRMFFSSRKPNGSDCILVSVPSDDIF